LFVDLIGKTWKVFRVSPLHNFHYAATRMKQYGQRLREGLAALLTDSTVDVQYDASFSVADGLTLTENDSEAIKVCITRVHCMFKLEPMVSLNFMTELSVSIL